MTGHHFISYSSNDGKTFAHQLADALIYESPALPIWLDERNIIPGEEWDAQIVEAIRDCESLLFVMTAESVEDQSVCKQEWMRALRYKKPIIPLLVDPSAELPFRLDGRQYIDFSGDFETGLKRLRTRLQQLSTPRGVLQAMKDRLTDAQRDLRRATEPPRQAQIKDEIRELEQQIEQQQKLVKNPEQVANTTKNDIKRAIERERYTEPQTIRREHGTIINIPPATAPAYFQGRRAETERVAAFLEDPALRLLTIVGRGGIGKTVLVCRLLKALEHGSLPDDGRPLSIEGIVYLSANGARRVNLPNIYADLSKLLPDEAAAQLDLFYRNPRVSTELKMAELLQHFNGGRVALLLDNFEDLIDAETLQITDRELDEALRALLSLPQHSVKVIVTTRIVPRALALLEPGRQTTQHLDEGLPSPDAENLLRARDADGKAGLRDADDDLLRQAADRTRGYPRALEALYAILAADRDTSLPEILADTERLLPDNVIEALVGEAFSRLDRTAQRALEALAVYNRPVLPTAIDFLLQPYLTNIKSAATLSRLVTMQFVRKQGPLYYLHPVDRAYAFERIPRGDLNDRETRGAPPYTQFALLHRGAEYFKQGRLPEKNWKTINDLAAQLAEFDLRYAAEEYDTAAGVLLPIDKRLDRWGHYRILAELYELLRDRLNDYRLQQLSLDNLGHAYRLLGQYEEAIDAHLQALEFARKQKDIQGEGVSLSFLGRDWDDLGQPLRAMDYYKQSLDIARKIRDRHGEIARLSSLGNSYRGIGQIERAIEYQERSLTLAQSRRDQQQQVEVVVKNGLGLSYGDLGSFTQALVLHQQSLFISRTLGARFDEGVGLVNLAITALDTEQIDAAIQHAQAAITIGDEISAPRLSSYSNQYLALAQLYAGNLDQARAAAESAWLYNAPDNNHTVFALLGVIALRQDDRTAAREAFTTTIREANGLLEHTPQLYRALDSKALALCGLALLDNNPQHAAAAIEAYRAAREVTSAAGIVGRAVRLFDALAVLDTSGLLTSVCAAAAGETAD
jgi:tetratricopeptide (TPR) repeat protein